MYTHTYVHLVYSLHLPWDRSTAHLLLPSTLSSLSCSFTVFLPPTTALIKVNHRDINTFPLPPLPFYFLLSTTSIISIHISHVSPVFVLRPFLAPSVHLVWWMVFSCISRDTLCIHGLLIGCTVTSRKNMPPSSKRPPPSLTPKLIHR